jgi:hypothetical protein
MDSVNKHATKDTKLVDLTNKPGETGGTLIFTIYRRQLATGIIKIGFSLSREYVRAEPYLKIPFSGLNLKRFGEDS